MLVIAMIAAYYYGYSKGKMEGRRVVLRAIHEGLFTAYVRAGKP